MGQKLTNLNSEDSYKTLLLEVRNLCLNVSESFALQNISFRVKKNSLLAIVGESGSGKSLLAQYILNLSTFNTQKTKALQNGVVFFEGKDLARLDSKTWCKFLGAQIAYIPQEPLSALNPLQKVGKQILEAYLLHHKKPPKAKQAEILQNTLQNVGLEFELANRYPHELSGGQRQRILIAMSIINEPKIIFCDEPTTALDAIIQKQIINLLHSLKQKSSIVLITHDLSVVRDYADEIIVMKEGKIIESAQTKTLFTQPKELYTKELLDASDFSKFILRPYLQNEEILCVKNFNAIVQNHRFFYKQTLALTKNVNFTLHKGEILGVAGESGSGKSSLAYALVRLMRSSGEMKLFGKDVALFNKNEKLALARQINIVFQDPFSSLSPRMRVNEIIKEGLVAHNLCAKNTLHSAISKNLRLVGLNDDFLYRYPHELSGGQRQRVALARVLALGANILVLDEPTSALDKSAQKHILSLLLDLQRDLGLCLIFITHDVEILRYFSHTLLVLQNGYVIKYGKTQEIFYQARDENLWEVLSSS